MNVYIHLYYDPDALLHYVCVDRQMEHSGGMPTKMITMEEGVFGELKRGVV